MKNIIFIAIVSIFLVGCNNTQPTVSEAPIEKKAGEQQETPETVAAHTLDKEKDAEISKPSDTSDDVEKSDKKTKWTRSGTPIDVENLTNIITEAEKKVKANPSDEMLKKNLSQAYTKRGVALTTAQQYASAIGDYRKALKVNPSNEIAKTWITQIESIYKGMKREMPKEGEEPEPLDYKAEASKK